MTCCGEERNTPHCPQCGRSLKPLHSKVLRGFTKRTLEMIQLAILAYRDGENRMEMLKRLRAAEDIIAGCLDWLTDMEKGRKRP